MILDRLAYAWDKYRWRFPIFAMAEATRPLESFRQGVRRAKLTLLSQGTVGPGSTIEQDVYVSPRGRLSLGARVFVGRRSIFEIGNERGCEVSVGDGTWISHDCHVGCTEQIHIGSDVLIGEFVSIRDTTHRYDDPATPIRSQGDTSGPIAIEDGVWVGRGCLILSRPGGIRIGRDAIIAANSMVRCDVPAGTIWGGNPARFIRAR